ncbi:MAG: lactonase family protein [Sphaerochaetaceae bacterium]
MKLNLWIGTYTQDILFGSGDILHGKGKGIYHITFETRKNEIEDIVVNEGIVNPSYVIQSADGAFLFAVNETKEYKGMKSGYVSSFRVDHDSKRLSLISSRPTYGTDPCHLAVNQAMTHLFVANFMSGSISMYSLTSEGEISEEHTTVKHEGSSIHPTRQTGSHAHAVILSADERWLFVPDLGLDKVMVYEIDYDTGSLSFHEDLTYHSRKGSGPRSIVFHPALAYAYIINELDSTIDVLSYDGKGRLTSLQSVSTLPENYEGNSTCADIRISSCGKYLLGSNRGHDSIVCYTINQREGTLETLGHTSTRGKCPRNFFTVDDTVLVANQDSDTITVFSLNEGNLKDTGKSIEIPTPVCVNNRMN